MPALVLKGAKKRSLLASLPASGAVRTRPMPSTVVCSMRAATCSLSRFVDLQLLEHEGGDVGGIGRRQQVVALQAVGNGLAPPKLRAECPAQLAERGMTAKCCSSTRPSNSLLVKIEPGSGSPGTTSRCL